MMPVAARRAPAIADPVTTRIGGQGMHKQRPVRRPVRMLAAQLIIGRGAIGKTHAFILIRSPSARNVPGTASGASRPSHRAMAAADGNAAGGNTPAHGADGRADDAAAHAKGAGRSAVAHSHKGDRTRMRAAGPAN